MYLLRRRYSTHIHIHTHTRSHTAPHITTHSHTHSHDHTHTHTHKIHTHGHTHAQTHTHSHSHTYAHMRAHTGTHADTRPDAHTHKHTNVRTHIHTQPPCMADCSLPPGKKKPASMVCCAGKYHAYCLPFFQRSPPPPGRSNIATHAHTYTRAQPHAHTLAQTHIHTHTNVRTHRQPPCMADCPCPPTGKKKPRANVCCGGRFCACMLFAIFAAHAPPNCCVRRSVNVPPLV